MANETKKFELGDVLTIVTGRLVASRKIDAVYEILNWMTNDNLFTHQLPRASRECEPWLIRWFPELKDAKSDENSTKLDEVLDANRDDPSVACDAWVEHLKATLGLQQYYDVPRIPRDDHDVKNPITELTDMVGPEKVIVVEAE